MSKFTGSLILIVLLLAVSPTHADEGMWMPHQMKDLNLKAKGLKMNPGDLYKKDGTGLMSAVINLRGGTAEFVSPEGLILTNHHVAFGALQRASSKENDYITHGFLANSKAEEIPARGYNADVLLGYEDITAVFVKVLKKRMTPAKRYKALDRIKKKLIAKEEKKGKDIRCDIRAMYGGNQYYMFRFKRLRDVRIVYAPPLSIGNFGGDIDNWMWPRHTGDFTYMRAYVDKNGAGAPFSKDNVPYKPKAYFKISLDGLKEGDFTFIMGYPGRTYRNYTVSQFKDDLGQTKGRIKLYKEILQFIGETVKGDHGLQIKYSSLDKGLNNGLKNRVGKLEGFKKYGILEKKIAKEKAFIDWTGKDPERKKKYGAILAGIETFIKKNAAFYEKERLTSAMVSRYMGGAMMGQAYTIYRTVDEGMKPDIKRDASYQKRNLPRIKMGVRLAERRYDFDVDKAYFKFMLNRLAKMDKALHPKALAPVLAKGEAAVDAFVDDLYAKTILKDPKKRMELLNTKKTAQLLKPDDPFIKLAAELEKELKMMRDKKHAVDQEKDDLKKIYLAGLLEMQSNQIAPDANSSIRFTYGPIKGYTPKDAVTYTPFTTLKGIMEKEGDKNPFIVPAKLKALHQARDFGRCEDKNLGDVVTCFLNTTNVTGGNSGSAVLNAKGEQVGIIFDMTYESVTGDYYIIPPLQRSISVDIRYVVFVTEKFAGATHLLREMGL
jgi:hypothetical protein